MLTELVLGGGSDQRHGLADTGARRLFVAPIQISVGTEVFFQLLSSLFAEFDETQVFETGVQELFRGGNSVLHRIHRLSYNQKCQRHQS